MTPQQLVLSRACFSGTEFRIKLSLGLRAGAREEQSKLGADESQAEWARLRDTVIHPLEQSP